MTIGNQQFTYRNIKFNKCEVAMSQLWVFGLLLSSRCTETMQLGLVVVHAGRHDRILQGRSVPYHWHCGENGTGAIDFNRNTNFADEFPGDQL